MGGVCGKTINQPNNSQVFPVNQEKKQIPQGFLSDIKKNVQIIVDYADINSDQKQNLMNCFQFFTLNAKYLWTIALDKDYISRSVDVILKHLEDLLSVLPIYIRCDMMYTLNICQILASYSMIIFQYFVTNRKRFLEQETQIKLQTLITVIENHLQIERKDDPLINNIECLLFQIKAAITIAPTDSIEGETILKQFLGGALKAGLTFTLNDDLTESLQKGAIYIYKEYEKSQFKRKFELIYYITGLKYSILEELDYYQKELSDILIRITDFYSDIITKCYDWEVQCYWIQTISSIINYKIALNENQIKDIIGIDNYNSLKNQRQFIVQFKQQVYVSINNEDIKKDPDAEKIYKQLKSLQSLSKLQHELISGNKELKGYESLYMLKVQVGKQDNSTNKQFEQIINSILQKIKNLLTEQKKITITIQNTVKTENQQLNQIIEQSINSSFSLLQGIVELSQYKTIQSQEVKVQSDNQYLTFLYYTIDFRTIQDEKLLNIFQNQQQKILLKEDIKSIQQGSDNEIRKYNLKKSLKLKIDKYQKSLDQEQIAMDIEYIFQVLNLYGELLKSNIFKLQELQISEEQNAIQLYDYEGLKNTITLLHQIVQLATLDNQPKNQQTSKIQGQLNEIIVVKLMNYNLKVKNLQSIIHKPRAIQQIIQIQEHNFKELEQLIKGLKMIIDTLKYELVIQIQSTIYDQALQEKIKQEIQELEECESSHEQQQSVPDKVKQDIEDRETYNRIIPQKIQSIFEQIQKIKETQNIENQNEQEIEYNAQQSTKDQKIQRDTIKDLENLHSKLIFIIGQIKIFKTIKTDAKQLQIQQKENIEINKPKQEIQNQNQNPDNQHINKDKYVEWSNQKYSLNIECIKKKIDEKDQFVNQYTELESQMLMILKQIYQSRDFNNKQTFLTNILDKIQDKLDSSQWRIRQILVYELLQMKSNLLLVQTEQINKGLLVKLQIYETDQRIKKLFENSINIKLQNELMKQYWPTVEEQVHEAIKGKLLYLSLLSTDIAREKNDQEKQRKQKQYKIIQQEINDQIQNIQTITSSLGITVLFLQDLKLDLARMENTLNSIQLTVNSMGIDIKALIGKTFQELLEIRMRTILQPLSLISQTDNEIQDQSQIIQEEHVYIPIKAREKNYKTEIEEEEANLFSDDLLGTGLVNDFIRMQNRNSLLIHGMAGSGKSTAAHKIEQFLWKKYEMNLDQTESIPVVPIFISLPSLKDPIYSAVEETLKSDNYRFSDKQVGEFKEAVKSGQLRILFILDSYDELKQEFLASNINISNTNTLSKWRSPKDKGRYPKMITTSRTELLVTKGYFNWFISESNDLNKFQEIRLVPFNDSQIKQYIMQYYLIEVMKIIQQFTQIYDLVELKHQLSLNIENPQINKFIQNEHQAKAQYIFSQLWKPEKYQLQIEDLQLQVILVTPFMMEIVVVLLPMMVNKKSNVDSIKNSFISRYSSNNMEAVDAWQQIVKNQEFITEYEKSVVKSQKQMEQTVQKYFKTEQNFESIKQALVLEPLTSYDFYFEFFENYLDREIQKLKEQGENSDIKDELWEFAHKLANEMISNNLSQVAFKSSGLVFKKKKKDWKDQFFDDDCLEGKYKKQFRKCIPLNQKNGVFSFNHKSLQEFLVAKWFIETIDQLENEKLFTEQNWDQEYFKGVIRFIVDKVKYCEVIQRKLFNMLLNTRNKKIKLNQENMDKEMERNDQQLIQAGSNSIFLLYQSDYNFRNKDLSQIYIKDMNLAGINFYGTKLVGSNFINVNLSGSNLNNADLTQCQWNQIHINERPSLQSRDGYGQYIGLFFPNNSETIIGFNGKNVEQYNYLNATYVSTSYEYLKDILIMAKSNYSNLIGLVDKDNIYIFDTHLDKMTHQFKYDHLGIQIYSFTFSWEDRSLIFLHKNEISKFNLPQLDGDNVLSMDLTMEQIQKTNEDKNYGILASSSRNYILVLDVDKITHKFRVQIYDSINNIFLTQYIFGDNGSSVAVDMSIDGQLIAVSCFKSQGIFLYNIDQLETPKHLEINQTIDRLRFFKKSKYLTIVTNSNLIIVWDVLAQIKINMINVDNTIFSLAVKQDSMILAIGKAHRMINLYDIVENQQSLIKNQGHDKHIKNCAISNNGLLLVTGDDIVLKLWELSLGLQIGKNLFLHEGNNPYQSLFLEFTKEDEYIISIYNRRLIDKWNVSNQMKILSFDIEIHQPEYIIDQFFIDSSQIISLDAFNLTICDLSKKTFKQLEHSHKIQQNCIFSLNEQQHITVILQTKYETTLGTSVGELIFLNENNQQYSNKKFHDSQIIKIICLKDNYSYASVGMDNKIVISKQGIYQKSYLTDNPIYDIVYCNYYNQIFCCNTKIIIYNLDKDELPKYLELETDHNILTLGAHRSFILAGSDLGMIYFWDTNKSIFMKELKVSESKIIKIEDFSVYSFLALSSDGNIYFINKSFEILFKFKLEYQALYLGKIDNKILLGNDKILYLKNSSKFSIQQAGIIISNHFQNLTAVSATFHEQKQSILVADQNQLIQVCLQILYQINYQQFITSSSINKNKTLLLIGYDEGLVVQYNLNGNRQSEWQGLKYKIFEIQQYEDLILVRQKEMMTLMNWNQKEIIYIIDQSTYQASVNFNSCKFMNANIQIYSDIGQGGMYAIDATSKQITKIMSGQGQIQGICTNKDHFISWDRNQSIRVYEKQSVVPKFIFSPGQKLECNLAVYSESSIIRAASGINLLPLLLQKGAQLQQQ